METSKEFEQKIKEMDKYELRNIRNELKGLHTEEARLKVETIREWEAKQPYVKCHERYIISLEKKIEILNKKRDQILGRGQGIKEILQGIKRIEPLAYNEIVNEDGLTNYLAKIDLESGCSIII